MERSSDIHHTHTGKICRSCFGEIAEIVSNTKGLFHQQTNGKGDARVVNRIWLALGEHLADLLAQKKSAIVPDFLHASMKVNSNLYFDESTRVVNKPQLVLLPDFTSRYHLQNVLVMKDAHYHATVPRYVNYSTISNMVGVNRYVVEAAVKDSIAEIGKYTHRNPTSTLSIDIGIGILELCNREYRMKWSPRFFENLKMSFMKTDSLLKPYDPPSMLKDGPDTECRFQAGCLTHGEFHQALENTKEAEMRLTVAEMNDGLGGSSYRKTYW
ncbi:unnamed protein product [Phytomonas sp. Hart1]|nr:unnamed protein product [Phytomonas sp. Hart1]|eukprot:CCW69931.1 unnamed protein product [Phytomonas sp. isolate Hart1]